MQSFDIKCFLTLAKYKNFSVAAEQLFTSQPSLSKRIRSLEEEMELKLFDRVHRGVRLTPEGEIMLDYFNNASANYQDALHMARNLKRHESHLTIALLENLDTDLILKPLFDFQSKSIEYPVTYTFIQLPYREIFFYLQTKRADLAITVNDPQSPSSIQMYQVALKPIVKSHNNLFFSKNHPALKANQPPVLSDFRDSRFFLPMYYKAENANEKEYSLQEYFSDLLGFTPKFEFLESVSSILPNILNGDGAAILINPCQIKRSSLIQSLPLANEASICFAWMQDNNNILLRQLIDSCPFEA